MGLMDKYAGKFEQMKYDSEAIENEKIRRANIYKTNSENCHRVEKNIVLEYLRGVPELIGKNGLRPKKLLLTTRRNKESCYGKFAPGIFKTFWGIKRKCWYIGYGVVLMTDCESFYTLGNKRKYGGSCDEDRIRRINDCLMMHGLYVTTKLDQIPIDQAADILSAKMRKDKMEKLLEADKIWTEKEIEVELAESILTHCFDMLLEFNK